MQGNMQLIPVIKKYSSGIVLSVMVNIGGQVFDEISESSIYCLENLRDIIRAKMTGSSGSSSGSSEPSQSEQSSSKPKDNTDGGSENTNNGASCSTGVKRSSESQIKPGCMFQINAKVDGKIKLILNILG